MVRIGSWQADSAKFLLDRRELMAGLGAAALTPAWPGTAAGRGGPSLALQAKAGNHRAWTAGPAIADLVASAAPDPASPQARRHARDHASHNDLPVPTVLNWRRDRRRSGRRTTAGTSAARARRPGNASVSIASRRHLFLRPSAGSATAQARPSRGAALDRRARASRSAVDRDEVFLIEDWRLRAGRNRDRARHRSEGHRRRSTPSTDEPIAGYPDRAPTNASDFASSMAVNALSLR